MPAMVKEKFPYGIEIKVSRVIAGCARAQPYVEEWLRNVEQALRTEAFYSPDSFEWQSNQYFELVKPIPEANSEAVMRVKAFLNGTLIAEATPNHLSEQASIALNAILDKYSIPYNVETQVETRKVSPWLITIVGITAGALVLYGLSKIVGSSTQEDKKQACTCDPSPSM